MVRRIPEWVIDWLIAHVIGKIFSAQAECALRMHDAPAQSEHLRAIAADPGFYRDWLAPRVEAVEAAERAPRA